MSYLQKFAYSWRALGRAMVFVWQHVLVLFYLVPWFLVSYMMGFINMVDVATFWRYSLSGLVSFRFVVCLHSFIASLIIFWVFTLTIMCMIRYVLDALQNEKPSFWVALRLPSSLLIKALLWASLFALVSDLNAILVLNWLLGHSRWIFLYLLAMRYLFYISTYVFAFLIDQRVSLVRALIGSIKFIWRHFLENFTLLLLIVFMVHQWLFAGVLGSAGPLYWSTDPLYFILQIAFKIAFNWYLNAVIIILPVIIYNDNKATITT